LNLRELHPPDADWEGEEESLEQPTVKGNAKSLLDRTTNEMKKFKDMRKNIEERQKLLESRLEEAGDELKEKILQQITHSKNRINSINTSLKTQIRKIKMAKSILTKKSLVEEETLNNE